SLLFLDRFLRGGRRRDAILWAAMLMLQGLSGTYYLVFSLLFAPVWIAGFFFAAGRRPTAREGRALAFALGLAALPVALLPWPYLVQFRALGLEKRLAGPLLSLREDTLTRLRSRGFEGSFVPGADLLSYLAPPAESWLWGRFGVSGSSELPHFFGFAAARPVALGLS